MLTGRERNYIVIVMNKLPTRSSMRDNHFESYKAYFKSGYYRKRYPHPNPSTLACIAAYLSNTKTAVDIGCGDGRYSVPMSKALRHITCIDISDEAVADLRARIHSERIENIDVVICEPPVTLKQFLAPKSINVVTMIFGVLSHIVNDNERHTILSDVNAVLSDDGVFILSVPNKQRRFRQEQLQQETSTISYSRNSNGTVLKMSYKLYDAAEITQELLSENFTDISIVPETVFAESVVVKYRWIAALDYLLCRIVPRSWAYGFLIRARKQPQ